MGRDATIFTSWEDRRNLPHHIIRSQFIQTKSHILATAPVLQQKQKQKQQKQKKKRSKKQQQDEKMASNKNTSSSALNTLKAACTHKRYVSFKDLPIGEYIVNKFSIVNTVYGERIRVDLQDTFMYLPQSFLKTLTSDVIDELNKSPKLMIYQGKDVNNRNALILDFNDVSYFDNDLLGLLTPNF